MICLASEVNFSLEQAVSIAKNSIEKKGLAFWEASRKVTKVYDEEIHMVYFPYHIMDLIYKAKSGVLKKVEARQIMAMEGVTGEVGAVVGIPVCQEKELPEEMLAKSSYTAEETEARIIDYTQRYFVRTKRFIPEIIDQKQFLVYKPAYIIPLDFEVKGRVEHTRKVVDAESGYLVYRYDRIAEL